MHYVNEAVTVFCKLSELQIMATAANEITFCSWGLMIIAQILYVSMSVSSSTCCDVCVHACTCMYTYSSWIPWSRVRGRWHDNTATGPVADGVDTNITAALLIQASVLFVFHGNPLLTHCRPRYFRSTPSNKPTPSNSVSKLVYLYL